MTEKLKGEVTVSTTLNIGNYNSKRWEYKMPFYLNDRPVADAFKEAQEGLNAKITEDGYGDRL